HLYGMTQRGIRRASVDIVDAQHVGEKDTVELAPLQSFRKAGPVFEIGVIRRAVARVRPQARRLVPDAVHLEGVEADLLHHPLKLSLRAKRSNPPAHPLLRRGIASSLRSSQ